MLLSASVGWSIRVTLISKSTFTPKSPLNQFADELSLISSLLAQESEYGLRTEVRLRQGRCCRLLQNL